MYTVTYNDGKSVSVEVEVAKLSDIREIAGKLHIWWQEKTEFYGYGEGSDLGVFIEYEGSSE